MCNCRKGQSFFLRPWCAVVRMCLWFYLPFDATAKSTSTTVPWEICWWHWLAGVGGRQSAYFTSRSYRSTDCCNRYGKLLQIWVRGHLCVMQGCWQGVFFFQIWVSRDHLHIIYVTMGNTDCVVCAHNFISSPNSTRVPYNAFSQLPGYH